LHTVAVCHISNDYAMVAKDELRLAPVTLDWCEILIFIVYRYAYRGETCTRFWWESPREKPLGRPRRRWEEGIEIDLRELAEGVEWIHLPQNRNRWRALVNAVMNLRVLAPRS
jgi:hypothetical protein